MPEDRSKTPKRLVYKVEKKQPIVQKGNLGYPWQNPDVFVDDLPVVGDRFLTYDEDDINKILFTLDLQKANKTGPTVTNNIALLDFEGDIVDSGEQLSDISYTVFDGGEYDENGEL